MIPPYYDSLVGKLIVHGRTRTEALMRLRRALDEFVVEGVETTLPLFRTLVRNSDVQNGQYDIHWLEDFLKNEPRPSGEEWPPMRTVDRVTTRTEAGPTKRSRDL